ncbi:serine/threonine protein kinase [bacterium AH-315-E10]|nr:serine/threonine protein kinase [bacterium AH-315-E10]
MDMTSDPNGESSTHSERDIADEIDAVESPDATVMLTGDRKSRSASETDIGNIDDDGHHYGTIGKYELIEFLGRGACAMVYRVKDPDGSFVAMKILNNSVGFDPAEMERFAREVDAEKLLRKHPNIITTYDTGSDNGCHYIIMELIEGGTTLRDIMISDVKLRIDQILDYAIAVAQALAYAHEHGIVHRDLKPANILINEFNQPLLADFGLAKFDNSEQLTLTGALMGTPKYMSPEHVGHGDGEVNAQSDLYSFGVMLYEMIVSEVPFPYSSDMPMMDIFQHIIYTEAKRPSNINSQVDKNLDAVVLKLLAKNKSERYSNMEEVVADLESCRAGRDVSVRVPRLAEIFERWIRKHTILAMLIFVSSLFITYVIGSKIQQKLVDSYGNIEVALLKSVIEDTPEQQPTLSKGEIAYSEAITHLRNRELGDARERLKDALSYAKKSDNSDLVQITTLELTRIAVLDKEYAQAVEDFAWLADQNKQNLIRWQIYIFEMGVAEWIWGKTEEAETSWKTLIITPGSEIELSESSLYINYIAEYLLGQREKSDLDERLGSFPDRYQAYALFALSLKETTGLEKNVYLERAVNINKYRIAWITKTELKNDIKKEKKK